MARSKPPARPWPERSFRCGVPPANAPIIASPVADHVAQYRDHGSSANESPTVPRAHPVPGEREPLHRTGWWLGSAGPEPAPVPGDDDVLPITVGGKIATVNKPWMRSIVPFTLGQAGINCPSRARTSTTPGRGARRRAPLTAAATWSYEEAKDGEIVGATTVLDARDGGQWALEIDPRSAIGRGRRGRCGKSTGVWRTEPVTNVKNPATPAMPPMWTCFSVMGPRSCSRLQPGGDGGAGGALATAILDLRPHGRPT